MEPRAKPSGTHSGCPFCWPKTNRLPDISAAKIFFCGGGISRELKFRACNHDKSPSGKGRETPLQRGERSEVAVEKKESMAFHWLNSYQERRGAFHPPDGSAISRGHKSTPSDLSSLFNWALNLSIFYTSKSPLGLREPSMIIPFVTSFLCL